MKFEQPFDLQSPNDNSNRIFILKHDLEFARLFTIKESLIKTYNSIRNKNFNKIELLSTCNKVNYENYQISTSVEKNIIMSCVVSFFKK